MPADDVRVIDVVPVVNTVYILPFISIPSPAENPEKFVPLTRVTVIPDASTVPD